MKEERDDVKKSLRRRKKISIENNDTQYQEMDTTKLFENGKSNEFNAIVVDLTEKNRTLVKEIRNIKIEQK